MAMLLRWRTVTSDEDRPSQQSDSSAFRLDRLPDRLTSDDRCEETSGLTSHQTANGPSLRPIRAPIKAISRWLACRRRAQGFFDLLQRRSAVPNTHVCDDVVESCKSSGRHDRSLGSVAPAALNDG